MENIETWLRRFGLNNTEIEVYLCIASHPHAKTADIQKYTSLVRTTIYYSLAELKNHGLISENYQNNIKTYVANDPTVLSSTIESTISKQHEMLKDLKKLKPFFPTNHQNAQESSHVSRYEGDVAIKQAIDLALRCDSKRWHILASHDNYLRGTTKKYQQHYLSERQRRGIVAKTLWEPHDEMKSPQLKDIVFRNPRILPEEFRSSFDSLVIIYDDTCLFVQPYEQMTAHAINDPMTTHVMRLLFMSIWDRAPSASEKR